MPTIATGFECPECGQRLTRTEKGPAWCPACEWNLADLGPDLDVPRGWGWLVRRCHRLAFRLDGELFEKYSTQRPLAPETTAVGRILLAVSLALVLADLSAAVWGVVLIIHGGLAFFGGIALILLAILIRPRFGRGPKKVRRLRREKYPALYALVDEVAAAAGTHAPDLIAIAFAYNASVHRYGLRQRRVLTLGMPLWLVLEPQERVAVLAHELGHEVNGDPARRLLVGPALATFGILAGYTRVSVSATLFETRRRPNLIELVLKIFLKLLNTVFLVIHIGLAALGFRDTQRAEYLADGIAADVAGSEAVLGLFARFLLLPQIANVVGYNAETKVVSQWRGLADNVLTHRAADLPLLRQLTMRNTSLWDSHPPTGRRARMAEAWPAVQARITPTAEQVAAIDRELLDWYKAAHQTILGTRTFRRVA